MLPHRILQVDLAFAFGEEIHLLPLGGDLVYPCPEDELHLVVHHMDHRLEAAAAVDLDLAFEPASHQEIPTGPSGHQSHGQWATQLDIPFLPKDEVGRQVRLDLKPPLPIQPR